MSSSWLSLVPIVDGFAYDADMICEDCAAQKIEQLEAEGIADSGDSNDFPQGPFPDNEADTPQHCGNHEHCVNAVKLPGGTKVGCPLSGTLTEDGVSYTRNSIAEHILFGSVHQKAMGRLWWYLFSSAMDNGPLIQLTRPASIIPPAIKRALPHLTSKTCHLLTESFTDLENVYGGAVSRGEDGTSLILWRLSIDDTGKLCSPATPVASVQLPHSELQERSLEDILSEAISDGAWY